MRRNGLPPIIIILTKKITVAIVIKDIDPEDVYRIIVLRKTLGKDFKKVAFVVKYAELLDRKTINEVLNGSRWLTRQLEGLISVLKTPWLKGVLTEIVSYLKKAISYGRLAKWIKVYFHDLFVYYLSNAVALTSTFINMLQVLFG